MTIGLGISIKAAKFLAKKLKKKKVYPETEDLTHQVGPYAGDVGSEGGKGKATHGYGRAYLKGRKS